jgi:hypothetical protein
MRRLKDYRARDAFSERPRPRSQRLIRWIYLASLVGLAIWLGNLFLGRLVVFSQRGHGSGSIGDSGCGVSCHRQENGRTGGPAGHGRQRCGNGVIAGRRRESGSPHR